MGGRGRKLRGGRVRPRVPKTDVGRMLQTYFQPALHSLSLASFASGDDVGVTLVDNSSDFNNAVLKWAKLTIRPIFDAENLSAGLVDTRTYIHVLYKRDQDDSATIAGDSAEVIRELRNDKKLLRGPWWSTSPRYTTSGHLPIMAGHMKPQVLKNFVMDREEDLVWNVTNVSGASSANAQFLDFALKGFVRVIT